MAKPAWENQNGVWNGWAGFKTGNGPGCFPTPGNPADVRNAQWPFFISGGPSQPVLYGPAADVRNLRRAFSWQWALVGATPADLGWGLEPLLGWGVCLIEKKN